MRTWPIAIALACSSCADEPGIELCVDATGFQSGDEIELAIAFAASATGPSCQPIRRAAGPLPYCVAATPGERYGHAMALGAVWRRGELEIGRREVAVPFDDGRIVKGDVLLGACCQPSDSEHECVDGSCEPIRRTGFLDVLVEPVECEQ
jgi:hypothetical protein